MHDEKMSQIPVVKLCLLTGLFFSLCTAVCLNNLYRDDLATGHAILWIVLSVGSLTLAAATLDIYHLDPAPSHSFKTLLSQYLDLKLQGVLGWASYLHLVWASRDCTKLQEHVLLNILKRNAGCEYGRRFRFEDIGNRDEFTNEVPLSTYKEYRREVKGMVERGDQNVIMSQDAVAFALTSGTTGPSKLFPLTANFFKSFLWHFAIMFFSLRIKMKSLKRIGFLRYSQLVRQSSRGLVISGIGSMTFKPRPHFVSPTIVYEIPDEQVAMYLHALFFLKTRDINHIDGFMAPLCHAFFVIIERECDRLCRDIAGGFLGNDVAVDRTTRETINQCLSADAPRAEEVRKEVSRGNIALARRLWPELKFMTVITTGAGFAHFAHLLDTTYLHDIRHVSVIHSTSEGMVGNFFSSDGTVNDNHYSLTVRLNFFEFIPEAEVENDKPQTLFIDQLIRGECYELVLTTNCGLYRYRLGDVIKVVDYINGCPCYEFMYSSFKQCHDIIIFFLWLGVSLSVSAERTSEQVIVQTMLSAMAQWENISVVNYTTTESHVIQGLIGGPLGNGKGTSPRYIFFIEVALKDASGEAFLTPDQSNKVDEILRENSDMYDIFRRRECVAPCDIIHVKRGTFDGLKQLMTKSTQAMQFKMPVVLRQKELLQFILGSMSMNDPSNANV